ncbi:MAG: ABC transporter ATP-binding protein [SAR202 cluster bacterium]|nr:ABC transporter ATP-binding protein [SAR202 cluster bacterium]
MTFAFRWHFSLAVLAVLLSSTFFLWLPRVLGVGIDDAIRLAQDPGADPAHIRSVLLTTAILVIVISLLRGTFAFGQGYLGETLGQKLAALLRLQYFDKLQTLSYEFHDKIHTGNLMSRGITDVEGMRMFVQTALIRLINISILILASAVLMLMLNWQLALLSLIFVPFIAVRSSILQLHLRRIWNDVQRVMGELTTVMQENLAGVRVVRAFSGQDFEQTKFRKPGNEQLALRLKAARISSHNGSLMGFAFLLAWAFIIWFGGNRVLEGTMTVGELSQFLFYMALLQSPIRQIPMLVNGVARASSAGRRVFEVLDEPIAVRDRPGAGPIATTRGVVRFENVSFMYGTTPVLDDISFEASPDHSIGIVGSPGSGKSTITLLVPRFYDVDAGRITIDGQDIREVTHASLRQKVGLVMQDPFLFDGTIGENIAYGDPRAAIERIEAAARIAQIHEFVASLPAGYNTEVGERGVALSGGQRQRVSIARVVLLNPPIMIFDDSTSSVDAGTEKRIREGLEAAAKGHTSIIVAHRLSSLQHVDEILVLDHGKVVERGTHPELIRLGGRYRELYELQRRPGDVAGPQPVSVRVATDGRR